MQMVDRHRRIVYLILLLIPALALPAGLSASGDRPDLGYVSKYNGKRFDHDLHGGMVLVRFRTEAPSLARLAAVRELGLGEVYSADNAKHLGVYAIPGGDSVDEILPLLRGEATVAAAEPLLVDQEGYPKYYVPGEFTVQFRHGVPPAKCEAILASFGSEIVTRQWTPGYYTATIPDGMTLFEAIRALQGHDAVRFAEGSVVGFDDLLYVPNDPLYPDQWHLENDSGNPGTPGADVSAEAAWDITTGSASVVIAIIDTGMDLDHPDLAPNLLPRNGEDWDFSGSGTAPDDSYGHGTSCSGLAAGVADNGQGVSGVCPECSLMPLKIDLSSGANQNRADAINFLVSKAVSDPTRRYIGSCSWRMSSGDFTAVEAAMQNAYDHDVVMLVASGNGDGAVDYPAKYPTTIAVGASSPCDERKSPVSCDGESFWGSNYGPEQTVVAPGVLMTTTSIGGYTSSFNGTSSACPTAAGVVGLILSVDGTLSRADVQQILENSADDQVGPPAEDPPGWDQWMGWGRVNAQAAVEATATLGPPSIVSVTPSRGLINAQTAVTIHGDDFFGQVDVTFGGKPAADIQVLDPQTIVCTCPIGEVLGSVDLEVSTAFGSDVEPDAYTYDSLWVALGDPVVGQTVGFAAVGPPNGKWGAVVDTAPGPTLKKGVVWCLGFSPARSIIHNAWRGDSLLNGIGQGVTSYAVPDNPSLVGQTLYTQAVFDGNGPTIGRPLVLSDCVESVILGN
jgi:hypothetical protein